MKWKQNQLDTNKQNVSSQIAAMNAATASVITLTSGTVFVIDIFFPPLHSSVLVSTCFSIFTFCSGCRPAGGCGPPSCGCSHIDHLVQLAGNGQRRQAHLCFDGRRGARRPAHGRYASTLQGLLRPAGCRQTREQQCKTKILTSHLFFFCAVLQSCRPASLSLCDSLGFFNYHSPSRRGISV